ncbi:hypothetical protein P4388_31140 [Bacillus thuringiensis]|nr:hypothetical protein [Bacillus thuringiensis]
MKMKIAGSILATTLAVSTIGSSYALADSPNTTPTKQQITNQENTDITTHKLYKELDVDSQKLFIEIVNGANLPYPQQVQLLQDKDRFIEEENNSSMHTWKTALVKKAAKLLAAKIGSKSVADITDYLFEWEDDLQQGMENYLVYKLGWNKTAAHWTAKSVMFILF